MEPVPGPAGKHAGTDGNSAVLSSCRQLVQNRADIIAVDNGEVTADVMSAKGG